MKFDFCIGNPPYQGENDNNGRKPPVYNYFMEEAYKIATSVELITPARFLFDAGQTPKAWNEKMLNDEHVKVLQYEPDAEKVFSNTEIKGGVAITIRNETKDYGKIGLFTPYSELNEILRKVLKEQKNGAYMDQIVSPRGHYRFTDVFFIDYPKASTKLGVGTGNMLASNVLDRLSNIFNDKQKGKDYLKIIGLVNKKKDCKWIEKKYIQDNPYTDTYNLAFSKSNGSGKFGEALTEPFLVNKGECTTDTYMSVGMFENKQEAYNLLKYIKTKFFRAMLGVKKVTQDNSKSVWKFVPLQDFTNNSDINWKNGIQMIDKQLYKKYKLSKEDISFIETHVREME